MGRLNQQSRGMSRAEMTYRQAVALINLALQTSPLTPRLEAELLRIPHRYLVWERHLNGTKGAVCLLEGLTAFPDVLGRVLDGGLDPGLAPHGGAGVLCSAITAEIRPDVSADACATLVDRLIAAGVDPEAELDGMTPLTVALGLSIRIGRVPAALPRLLAKVVRLEIPTGEGLVPAESFDHLPEEILAILRKERADRADPE